MAADTPLLSPLDAAFLYFETPTQPLHVGCLTLLDAPVPFDELITLFEDRLLRLRRYRQRAVRPAFDLALPSWEDAPDFDPRRHVRRVAVPPPGDEDALHELVDALFATALDPGLPLWEAYLIEGGRITRPVRNATLIGNGPEALTKVSRVGHDLKLDRGVGTCGKDGQSVPVGVGIPTIRIDAMTVGGTSRLVGGTFQG